MLIEFPQLQCRVIFQCSTLFASWSPPSYLILYLSNHDMFLASVNKWFILLNSFLAKSLEEHNGFCGRLPLPISLKSVISEKTRTLQNVQSGVLLWHARAQVQGRRVVWQGESNHHDVSVIQTFMLQVYFSEAGEGEMLRISQSESILTDMTHVISPMSAKSPLSSRSRGKSLSWPWPSTSINILQRFTTSTTFK